MLNLQGVTRNIAGKGVGEVYVVTCFKVDGLIQEFNLLKKVDK